MTTEYPYKNYLFFLKNFLSNFKACNFVDENGVKFCNTEQYFMYQKAITFNDFTTAKAILNTENPFEAKALGRQVRNYDEKVWNEKRYEVFRKANIMKYSQNPDLHKMLMDTGNLILVECNPNDKIWGIGLSIEEAKNTNPGNWQGQNLLGLVLMDVRAELSKGQYEKKV